MPELPTGTVTLLFADIEGSTRLLQELGPRYDQALEMCRAILSSAAEVNGGHLVDTAGDACVFVFPQARAAVTATLTALRALANQAWPMGSQLRVRMALHTGAPRRTTTGYTGLDVHHAAHLCDAAHGGQVVVSAATRALIGDDLPRSWSCATWERTD